MKTIHDISVVDSDLVSILLCLHSLSVHSVCIALPSSN